MPQITSLIGIQLVQRGKKLAMEYQDQCGSAGCPGHHNGSMLKSKCAAFRRSNGLRFLLRLRGNQDSINLSSGSKIRFIIQFHVDKEPSVFPIQKSKQLAKLMTSKVRQHVKPGSTQLIPRGNCRHDCCSSRLGYSASSARKWRLALFLAGFFMGTMMRAEDADLLLTNGNIYTVTEKQPDAEAVAVKTNRIVFVGSNEDAKKFHAAKMVDLHGRTLVPGFTDSHCHIFGIGEREMRLNLEGTNSREDFRGRVKERVDKTGPGKWITGRGWIETFWKPPQFPTRQDLDKIAPRNPVFLTRADGHGAIANSAALKIAKIDKTTPNPFGGEILKDKASGEPTGMLLDNAMDLVEKSIPKPSAAERQQALLTEKPEELKPMFEEALRRGIQVGTHAIGDGANRMILDLYEGAFKAVPPNQRQIQEPRWRVEHAQIVDPVDIPRFAKLGVIPSMQPSHAISDLFFALSRLGIDRLAAAYAWQSFLKSGSIICGGSDAPVERGEPMIEFYAAVARKSIRGESAEGWHPEQAVSRKQALKMFTIWPAYGVFEENDKGSIEVGKLADFTVLSQDILKIPEPEILKSRCVMTMIGGEVVFESAEQRLE